MTQKRRGGDFTITMMASEVNPSNATGLIGHEAEYDNPTNPFVSCLLH